MIRTCELPLGLHSMLSHSKVYSQRLVLSARWKKKDRASDYYSLAHAIRQWLGWFGEISRLIATITNLKELQIDFFIPTSRHYIFGSIPPSRLIQGVDPDSYSYDRSSPRNVCNEHVFHPLSMPSILKLSRRILPDKMSKSCFRRSIPPPFSLPSRIPPNLCWTQNMSLQGANEDHFRNFYHASCHYIFIISRPSSFFTFIPHPASRIPPNLRWTQNMSLQGANEDHFRNFYHASCHYIFIISRPSSFFTFILHPASLIPPNLCWTQNMSLQGADKEDHFRNDGSKALFTPRRRNLKTHLYF